jgi:two-component system response regulator AtoC
VLQDREFTKLGSNRTVEVDVRVIAATNRDLEQMMRQGTFREDLYYRLQVIEVHVPPLRERREEVPQLIEFFLLKFASVYHRPPLRPSLVLQEALLSYEWPGNIRELENMMKRLVVLQDETLILAELGRLRAARAANAAESEQQPAPAPVAAPQYVAPARPAAPAPPPPAASAFSVPAPAAAESAAATMGADGVNLQELARHAAMGAEKEAIQHALERFRWNRRKTAEYLQVSYKTLLNKMKECGISESPSA